MKRHSGNILLLLHPHVFFLLLPSTIPPDGASLPVLLPNIQTLLLEEIVVYTMEGLWAHLAHVSSLYSCLAYALAAQVWTHDLDSA